MSEHKIPIPSMIYNAAIGGHVTNSQQIIDENYNLEQKDINKEILGVPYNVSNPNGMGRIVLKKNDNFKQVVEAQTNGNTIFVIKYNYNLGNNIRPHVTIGNDKIIVGAREWYYTAITIPANKVVKIISSWCVFINNSLNDYLGTDYVITTKESTIYIAKLSSGEYDNLYEIGDYINIPVNCVLSFEGGSLVGGNIICNNTYINSDMSLDDVSVFGTVANKKINLNLWKYDTNVSVSIPFQRALDCATRNKKTLYVNNGTYLFTPVYGRTSIISYKDVYIEGESQNLTIFKCVKDDLSAPDKSGVGYSTFLSFFTLDDYGKVELTRFTLDGNSTDRQTGYVNKGHVGFIVNQMAYDGKKDLSSIHIDGITIKNFEREAFYNAAYVDTKVSEVYVVERCNFINNGGNVNIGGSAVIRNCMFDNTSCEHACPERPATLIVEDCIFKNKNTMLSFDKQDTVSDWDRIIGTKAIIKNNHFEIEDSTFTTTYSNISAVQIRDTEDVIITNNIFKNASYNVTRGGCTICTDRYVKNVVLKNNTILTKYTSYEINNQAEYTISENNTLITSSTTYCIGKTVPNKILAIPRNFMSSNVSVLNNWRGIYHIKLYLINDTEESITSGEYFYVQEWKVIWTTTTILAGEKLLFMDKVIHFNNSTPEQKNLIMLYDANSSLAKNGKFMVEVEECKDVILPGTDAPSLTSDDAGKCWINKTTNKITLWNGTAWVDATGTLV